jgi:hypothetical protein
MEEVMMNWLGSVHETVDRCLALSLSIVLVWCLLPFSAQFVLHPDDVIRLQHRLEGFPVPTQFTGQQMLIGEISAVVTIAALTLLLLGLLTVLYHRLSYYVVLWPIGLVLFGLIGNGIWRYFGFTYIEGMIVGFVPAALTLIWQRAAEGWAADFVFGRGNRPTHAGSMPAGVGAPVVALLLLGVFVAEWTIL